MEAEADSHHDRAKWGAYGEFSVRSEQKPNLPPSRKREAHGAGGVLFVRVPPGQQAEKAKTPLLDGLANI